MTRHDSSFEQEKTILAEMDNVSRDSQRSFNNYFYNRWSYLAVRSLGNKINEHAMDQKKQSLYIAYYPINPSSM